MTEPITTLYGHTFKEWKQIALAYENFEADTPTDFVELAQWWHDLISKTDTPAKIRDLGVRIALIQGTSIQFNLAEQWQKILMSHKGV